MTYSTTSILKRLTQSENSNSVYLNEAIALARTSLVNQDLLERINELANLAPKNEEEMFGDLMSNLFLRTTSN